MVCAVTRGTKRSPMPHLHSLAHNDGYNVKASHSTATAAESAPLVLHARVVHVPVANLNKPARYTKHARALVEPRVPCSTKEFPFGGFARRCSSQIEGACEKPFKASAGPH